MLLQFPDSGTAVLFLSERVTLLLILKGTLKCQQGESLFSKDLGIFWFQTLESKMLDPTCCIRWTTSCLTLFKSFQQCWILWPGLYGLNAVKCNLTELTTRSTSLTFAVSGLLDMRMCQDSSCSWSIGRCSSFVGVLVSVF